MSFTRHDQEMLEIMLDPAKWAAHHLGEAPRWYQEEILRHPHHRKVLRCGRRIGKTWTMTAHMLWVAFTCNGGTNLKKGATCLVATPYDSQAREIFDQLQRFINDSQILTDSVKSMTKNPYVIEFKNKSRIKLFTAGTRSGAEGGSMRGQKADWLYLDEMDYLSDKDFETIYAISLEAPKRIGIMAASTPTGRRGKFYDICTNNDLKFSQDNEVRPDKQHKYNEEDYDRETATGWKEFYFPTMVNPEWDQKMEAELRGMYTQVAYEHEVLAEFGTELVGVFNKEFVDEASDFEYQLQQYPIHNAPTIIGIDWDKFGTATQIVVVQFEPNEVRREKDNLSPGPGRFKVINRIEIAKGEFTYDNAVKKVIELDRIYNPAFIYPDRGAGEYQIEMLRKALGDKVKGIHLGSSHEVRDPVSRVFERKPIKPFMVNQTVLMLERGMLRIPHRRIDEEIVRQMTNYQVLRIAAKTGEPSYSNTDEHALDAMMLALLGFVIEMPDLTETIHQIEVARIMAFVKTRQYDPLTALRSEPSTRSNSADDEWDEPGSPPLRKVPVGSTKKNREGNKALSWGDRGNSRSSYYQRDSW